MTASQRSRARKRGEDIPKRKPGRQRQITVDAVTGCHVAVTSHPTGYAYYKVDGHRLPAHRVVWEEQVGPIPVGLTLDHLCRNRACVNPAHLEPVTIVENIRRAPRCKLSLALAREIRASSETGRALAARYGVSEGTISLVRSGQVWQEEGTRA